MNEPVDHKAALLEKLTAHKEQARAVQKQMQGGQPLPPSVPMPTVPLKPLPEVSPLAARLGALVPATAPVPLPTGINPPPPPAINEPAPPLPEPPAQAPAPTSKQKEECPGCGKMYLRLKRHTPTCKAFAALTGGNVTLDHPEQTATFIDNSRETTAEAAARINESLQPPTEVISGSAPAPEPTLNEKIKQANALDHAPPPVTAAEVEKVLSEKIKEAAAESKTESIEPEEAEHKDPIVGGYTLLLDCLYERSSEDLKLVDLNEILYPLCKNAAVMAKLPHWRAAEWGTAPALVETAWEKFVKEQGDMSTWIIQCQTSTVDVQAVLPPLRFYAGKIVRGIK